MKMDAPTGSSSVLSNQVGGESSDSEEDLAETAPKKPKCTLRTVLALAHVAIVLSVIVL